MSNKKRIVRLFIGAFIFALICVSLLWQSVQADKLSVNRPGFIKLSSEILKDYRPHSYSEALDLQYANQYRYQVKGDIAYSDDLALWYAQQYGNLNPGDARLATEPREIPEYSDALALWYAQQYGNLNPGDARLATEPREIPEYSDALALWYAQQYGNWNPAETVKHETE